MPVIAPVIQPLLALFPNPNLPNSQYTFSASEPIDEHYGQVRLDQTFRIVTVYSDGIPSMIPTRRFH